MQSRNSMNAPSSHTRKISYADMAQTYRNAGPLVPQHGMQHQVPQQSQHQLREQERLKHSSNESQFRSASKATDRNIPDELAEVTVGDGVKRYEQLRAAEKKLDALMMRKRLDLKENALRRYSRREGTLRLWISNTVEGQPWQVIEDGSGINEDGTFDFDNDHSTATWRMKIEGKLLEAQKESSEGESSTGDKQAEASISKFSDFFDTISIDFNRSPALQPDGFSQISWKKQKQDRKADPKSKENYFDSLEFERKGDENINVTVSLIRDEEPKRYRLSPALSEILNTEEDDMPGLVQGIWEYARAMNLHEDADKRTINCDEALAKVGILQDDIKNTANREQLFGQSQIMFPFLPNLLLQHTRPLPPVRLQYTIRVDKPYISPPEGSGISPSQPTVYDIRVPLPNAMIPILKTFHTNPSHVENLDTITKMDEDLALLVAKINNTNAKRKFYDNLSTDPAGFVQRWIGSQRRDLEVILAEATRGGGEDGEQWRKGGKDGIWGSETARESVGLWLARNPTK